MVGLECADPVYEQSTNVLWSLPLNAGGACRELSQNRRRRNKPKKDEIPQIFRFEPAEKSPPPDGGSESAPSPQEDLEGLFMAPRSAFVEPGCIIETFSNADAFSEEVQSIALSVSELFADLGADCGIATAEAEVGCGRPSFQVPCSL